MFSSRQCLGPLLVRKSTIYEDFKPCLLFFVFFCGCFWFFSNYSWIKLMHLRNCHSHFVHISGSWHFYHCQHPSQPKSGKRLKKVGDWSFKSNIVKIQHAVSQSDLVVSRWFWAWTKLGTTADPHHSPKPLHGICLLRLRLLNPTGVRACYPERGVKDELMTSCNQHWPVVMNNYQYQSESLSIDQ